MLTRLLLVSGKVQTLLILISPMQKKSVSLTIYQSILDIINEANPTIFNNLENDYAMG